MFLSGNFPHIEHIDDLKSKVSHHPEVRFSTHQNGFHTACYMIGNPALWAGEDVAYVRECRGITFYPDGKIASRSMAKFFNVGERPETQKGVIDWAKTRRIMDKRDGSMIHPVLVDGWVKLKTKKSFNSDVAIMAQAWFDNRINYIQFCKELLSEGMTPTFEYTCSKARIVINYFQEELRLLHIRNNITGNYVDRATLEYLARARHIALVDEYDFDPSRKDFNLTLEHFFHSLEVDEGMEGYVFQDETGEMFKAKSKWYLNLHHNMVFLTQRNVAEMVLEETLDDYKAYLSETESSTSLEAVEKIETDVSLYLATIEKCAVELYEAHKDWSKKDFAMECCKHKYFGLAVKLFEGREPDYKDYYRKWHLKDHWTCEQV